MPFEYKFSTADTTRANSTFPVTASVDNKEYAECWIAMPKQPVSETVQILEDRESSSPTTSIVGTSSERRVVDEVGTIVATVSSNGWRSLYRTRWSVENPDKTLLATFTERRRDVTWRRLVRPVPKALSDGVPDLFGAFLAALFYPILFVKPRCRLIVHDPSGRVLGFIEFASNSKYPRDHFSINLEDDCAPGLRTLMLAAAVSAVSVMH